MTTKSTLITSRDPKGVQAVNLFEAAYNKARLDVEAAQRLNESPDFATGLRDLIARCSVANDFAKEEVTSRFGYLSGYKVPKPIGEQLATLRKLFPQLGSCNESLATGKVPEGAEGYFVIPRWQTVAPTYNQAVQIVLDLLKQGYGGRFKNWREGELGPDRLRQSQKKAEAFEALGDAQEGHDLLVIAAQFGFRHRGKSVRRVRAIMKDGMEFGLGAFEIGIMLLTHPERLQHFDDLWIDCAGDEYAPVAGGRFVGAPLFCFADDRLEFDTSRVAFAHGHYGSASAFLPQ